MTHQPEPSDGSPTGNLVVIGLGANLGRPEEQLRTAARAIARRVSPPRASSLYQSAAIGPEQPDFLNAALLVSHAGPLADLLRIVQSIEAELGRERKVHWGPRVIDLDLLWAEARTSVTPELTVPHPELPERAFALLPLLELRPLAAVPDTGLPYTAFLPRVQSQRISVVRGPEWWDGTS